MKWLVLLMVACGGAKSSGPVEDLRDKMCACKDKACADAVEKELRTLKVDVTDDVAQQLAAAAECASKLAP